MNWEELIDQETYDELWLPLLNLLREHGDAFTYREIAKLWGKEKNPTYQKVNQWATVAPELVSVDKEEAPYVVRFFWEGLPEAELPEIESTEEEPDIPTFLTQRTIDSITEVLKGHGVLDGDYELEFERGHKWDIQTQRGQLITYVTKEGIRLVRALALYDNGFIVNKVRISTVKEDWK